MTRLALPAAPDVLDLHGAAAELGLAYHTFRKAWRHMADPKSPRFVAFPPPFRGPPPGGRGGYGWRASAIAEWKRAREAILGAGHAVPASNDDGREPLQIRRDPRLKRDRAELFTLMQGRA